ncbi:hypothetical protein B0T11DRAFT_358546 [Plectosphaerella cucumerina]|uniref:Copper-fist domain-containing protein n=1 Tax=Plectosphaerella cucumerina TaxID=40658 RepID=A0A8K0T3D0_9PEZI|nr:hypothetical protein B0T11DRAFT_358546 [Plectosphaerella cucumerina]
MLIDGEKWACEACVRGHRVSNCQHADRPLQHINKKGRPVSQCQHCRSMRKSRAAHVKCDCGEKTSKCAHLQPTLEGHRETCCCNHGGRCTCSHKKESGLDTVPEVTADKDVEEKDALPPRPRPPVRRRRANTVHSDGPLTFDKHGNYKPIHKHNKLGPKPGLYQLGRVNSMHSTSSLDNSSPDRLIDPTHRDALSNTRIMGIAEQRRVKSEAASPLLSGSSGLHHLHGHLTPLDLSGIEYPAYMPNSSFDLFSGSAYPEQDGPIFSAGLSSASVDWSHIELADKHDNFAPSSYGNTCSQSFNGMFDYGNGSEQAPTLAATTSTSGEVSEVEDSFIPGDVDYDGFSTADTTGFIRSGHLYHGAADLTSIDYDSFVKNSTGPKFGVSATFDEAGPAAPGSLNFDNDPLFWGQQFNDGINAYSESADGAAIGTEAWGVS